MPMNEREYNDRCAYITNHLQDLSHWKHIYFGAAYTTRLKALVNDLRDLTHYVDETIEFDT